MFGLSGPLLDACVLSILEGGDAYGYSLTQQVRQVMDVSESSLYPVLRRLEREGHLSTYNQAYQGRNRRYYSITPGGVEQYERYVEEWAQYKAQIDRALLGGESDE